MKSHTSEFKEEIKTLGKQQSVRITYKENNVTKTLTNEDINSATPNYEASLLKSVMKVLELDSNVSIPKGTEIKFEYGLLVNGTYEYLDYGNYIVAKEPEKQEDTLSYKITCYDKMLYSMKDYEHIDIPYPCTIKQYLVALCNKIGLQFKDSDFANASRQITNELFMTINEDGTYSSMGYTYRDVLDQIAETTGGCICMTLNDKVEVRYINKAINYETSKKSTNIEFETSVKEIVKIKELDGKSTQATRSGKNLFDASKISNGNIIVSDNGKTITMPIFTTGNGSETSGSTLKRLCPNLSIGDVVFLKFDRNLGITYNNFIYLTKTREQWENGSSKTITQEMLDSTVILYGNRYTSGETGQCILTNFRIVKNKDDEWEPYGASPSPEFPSEIKSVGDDVNLFDKDNYTIKGVNIAFDISNLIIGQQYTFSCNLPITWFKISKASDSFNSVALRNDNGFTTFTFYMKRDSHILEEETQYLFIGVSTEKLGFIKNINEVANYNFKIQKGDQSTPYSKYGEGTVTIEQRGKNLINPDKPSPSQTNGGITITNNGDGSYTAKGTSTKTLSIQLTSPNIIKLKANTYYTNSIEVLKGTMTGVITVAVKKSDNTIRYNYINVYDSIKTNTKIHAEDLIISEYSFYCVSGTEVDFTFRVQLEEGEEATDYEPYFSKDYVIPLSEPLRSLPNGTKDTIEEDGIHRKIYYISSYNNEELPSNVYEEINGIKYCNDKSMSSTGQFSIGSEVQYELAEEVVEPFTEEQLEVINSIETQNGTNIFEFESNAILNYPVNYDTINEEYINDTNVNFGEKYRTY